MGTTIKDAVLVEALNGKEKLPVSDGSGLPKSATTEQIKEFANKDMATKEELKEKQDVINDLEVIRSGASKGGTALQEVPEGYATTKYVDGMIAGKVDKVEGKQLSTEDFTTALKNKLEGLSNNDDTTISEAVEKLRTDFDTLVGGDTATAIESFNEIIAFLDGIEDSESLDSIIASIEQQIAAKYTKPSDGIPKSDLASDVQTSLGKADTALQEETYKGTVTSITAGDGLTGGTITGSGTIALENIVTAKELGIHPQSTIYTLGFPGGLNYSRSNTTFSNYAQKINIDKHGRVSAITAQTITVARIVFDFATTEKGGFMSATDKTKLDGIDMATKQDKIAVVDHGTSDTTFALTPNVFHKWGEVASLDLTLAEPSDATVYNEYMFEFVSGSTATTFSLPDTIEWVSTPSVEANTTYQCSIVNNVGIIVLSYNL